MTNTVTAGRRHFEDLAVGEVVQLGKTTVTKDMIIEFAREFVGSSRVDLQACKLEYSIVSPK